MRSPDALTGKVPQDLLDWLKDLYTDMNAKSSTGALGTAQTVGLAKVTPSGTDGSMSVNANGVVTSITPPT